MQDSQEKGAKSNVLHAILFIGIFILLIGALIAYEVLSN